MLATSAHIAQQPRITARREGASSTAWTSIRPLSSPLRTKYGVFREEYCKKVPCKILPQIYGGAWWLGPPGAWA